MDIYGLVERAKELGADLSMDFPGNWQVPAVTGDFMDPSKPKVSGNGDTQSSWVKWAAYAVQPLIAPATAAHSAAVEVTEASKRTKDHVVGAYESVIGSVTGFFSWSKWIAAAIIALAVIYVVAVIAPALKR